MYYDIFKELNKLDESQENKLEEVFETHSNLNQKLFDQNVLKEDVRKQLIKIADIFVDSIKEDQIPIKVYDYWLVGSNAAYNYNDESDIDVHIIVDINSLGLNPYLISLLYNYIKSSFNDKYDIKVKGHEVELYLEDIETTAITNGIYSLKQDKWVKEPTPTEVMSYNVEETELWDDWYERYQNIGEREAEQFLDDLYIMRKMSLANDGEFGTGNLVFKEFRNRGYIQELKNKKYKYKSDELTLEKLEEDYLCEVGVSGQTRIKKQIYNNLSKEKQQEIELALGAKPNDNFSALINIHHLNGNHDLDIPCNRVLINHGVHSSLQKIASLKDIDKKAKEYAKANVLMYGNCVLSNNEIQEQGKYYGSYQGKDANFFKKLLLYIESKK